MRKCLLALLVAVSLTFALSYWWHYIEMKSVASYMYTKFELSRWELESMGETFDYKSGCAKAV
ncbi:MULTISPECIES: hypothetical protein [Archaeoglobus]|jgi:hypothetical protein|uniref:Uncharacterized protein n=1 Tax=Archaeoglobus fulgidus DSM 8774 TaxID=1344584 RepID=A0A075WJ67_ARCFL|nr:MULTISPECIES: hypothetical protein [Archaeoglobus]AIG99284.1 hypothetical protein AFULGI_00025720 [Archaeoglobus fulgidus DSM 8774]MDI3497029.1 hypothetical protein [Archaeoglobus sp.]